MKKLFTYFSLFIVLSIVLSSFTACEKTASTQKGPIDDTGAPPTKSEEVVGKNKAVYPPLPEALMTADIKGLDGTTINLEDKKGKVVLINLWGIWCIPCIAEMPHLVELQEKYKDLEVIGLNVGDEDGEEETDENIKKFAEKQKLNYTLGYADRKLFSEFVKVSRMAGVPQSVLINREGKMTGVFTGGGSKVVNKMKETVDKVINE